MHPKREKSEEMTAGLNFLIPGAGFAYLGQWGWAALNALLFFVLLIVGALLHHPLIVWFVVALFGASFAVKAAKRHNEGLIAALIERIESQPSVTVGEAAAAAAMVGGSHGMQPPPPPTRASGGVPPPPPRKQPSDSAPPPPPPRRAPSPTLSPLARHVSELPPPPPPRATYPSEPPSDSSNAEGTPDAAPAHRFCSTCGAPAERARFCPQCGAQLMPKA
jgi:hypothetical protein